MSPTRLSTTFRASAALVGLALGAAMLAAPAPARAADDEPSIDQKVIRGLMEGLGFKRDGEATINYQERAPLVIPPRLDLPPPEKSDAVIANNPAWPKDPDITRRKDAERMERNRNISAEREIEENPLRPDQMTPGGNPRTPPGRRTVSNNLGDSGDRMTPSELGYKGGLWSNIFGGSKEEAAVKFTGEPPRTALTEPPPGYQTPSPDQPYGMGKAAPPKADNYLATHGEVDSGR
jgi:hypothetical protein